MAGISAECAVLLEYETTTTHGVWQAMLCKSIYISLSFKTILHYVPFYVKSSTWRCCSAVNIINNSRTLQ